VLKQAQSAVRRNVQALRQRGSFAQNFAVMFSATAATAAVGLLVSPIMSRLYAPAAYGVFAVFNGLVTNVTMVSTLAYPSAFLLPRLDKRFHALVHLSVLLAFANFAVVTVILLLFQGPLLRWLQVEALGNWVYAVPGTALVYNLTLIMNGWYLRTKEFRKQASINVATTLAGRALTLGAGVVLHGSATGLLLGEVFNKLVAAGSVFFSGINQRLGLLMKSFSWARIRAVAYEYREYPFYVAPSGYFETLAFQLPTLLLTSTFGPTAVGLYAFSTSLLELPIGIIGKAVGPVFFQKATETFEREPERLPGLCLDLYNKLLYLGLVPFGIITVYGDWLFRFVFGARWESAGLFTAYLGYYYVFRLASTATGPIYAVLRRQRLALWGIILLVSTRAASLGVGIYMHDVNLGMMLFGFSSLAVTFGVDMNILSLLKLPVWRIALRSVALVFITLGILFAIRLGIQHLTGW
jgi:O-antigen/teichoic acid export membrane protein